MANDLIRLGTCGVGPGQKPFIIAEMSGNHNQSLERALEIVDSAAACGVDALKIQTYTADTMTLDLDENEFFLRDESLLWKGKSLHKLYQEAYTPWEWHAPIFDRCRQHGIVGFSTPFDASAVDFLESLNVPFYKIASFENIDLPLIRKVAATGKPMIMSTGMADVGELFDAVKAARSAGCKDLILLKCTSSYPAPPEEINLRTIEHMRELFGVQVGLSDHTMGLGVAVASVAMGATVIEKHFTLRRADGGVDSAFSMEPQELKLLVEETQRAQLAVGKVNYGLTANENKSRVFRRSVYVVKDVRAGEPLTEENIRIIRPGHGMAPKHFEEVMGRSAKTDLQRGTPLSWNHVR